MFCRQCGNEIMQGSQFCDKCGCPANQQNAGFNNTNGFAPLSKKEYFKSSFCSEASGKRRKGAWIAFGIFVGLTLLNLVLNIIGTMGLMDQVDFDASFSEITEKLEKVTDGEFSISETDKENFEILEKEFGISSGEFIKAIFYGVVVGLSLLSLIAILLALIAAIKINRGCAIAALVISIVRVGTLSAIAGTAFMLYFIHKLNEEYKMYRMGIYGGGFGNSEPYFG